jgi:hypothetical protein
MPDYGILSISTDVIVEQICVYLLLHKGDGAEGKWGVAGAVDGAVDSASDSSAGGGDSAADGVSGAVNGVINAQSKAPTKAFRVETFSSEWCDKESTRSTSNPSNDVDDDLKGLPPTLKVNPRVRRTRKVVITD